MTCAKDLAFDTLEEARRFLRYKTGRFTGLKVPIRAYRCGKCKKYHVTSKPRRRFNG